MNEGTVLRGDEVVGEVAAVEQGRLEAVVRLHGDRHLPVPDAGVPDRHRGQAGLQKCLFRSTIVKRGKVENHGLEGVRWQIFPERAGKDQFPLAKLLRGCSKFRRTHRTVHRQRGLDKAVRAPSVEVWDWDSNAGRSCEFSENSWERAGHPP